MHIHPSDFNRGDFDVAPKQVALEHLPFDKRFIVRADILHHPAALGVVHEEKDFLVKCHVRILRFDSPASYTDVLPDAGVRLARRTAPDKVEFLEVLAEVFVSIPDNDRVSREMIFVDFGYRWILFNSNHLMLIAPELPISSNACIQV